jgi:hypothetical protein
VDLSKIRIPLDGFFVICATTECEDIYLGNTCDYTPSSFDNAANNQGNEAVAIISGSLTNFQILDLYGVIGTDGFGTGRDFEGGRVVRKYGIYASPTVIWNPSQWIIFSPANTGQCDPGEWKEEVEPISPDGLVLIISEVATPSDSSVSNNNNFVELYSPNKKNFIIQNVSCVFMLCLFHAHPSARQKKHLTHSPISSEPLPRPLGRK